MNISIKKYIRLSQFKYHYIFIRQVIETEKVSVFEVFRYLFSFWKVVLFSGIIFMSLGVFFSIDYGTDSYTSVSVVVPGGSSPPKQLKDIDLKSIMSGELISSKSDLGIESFQGIIENYPFLLNLLEQEIISEKYGGYVKIEDYINQIEIPSPYYVFTSKIKSIPDVIFRYFKPQKSSSEIVNWSKKIPIDTLNVVRQEKFRSMALLLKHVSVVGANPVKIITIMPEAKVSTRLNNLVYQNLVKEVTRIKTAKLERDLKLNKIQLDEAKVNFLISQKKLADFRDANKGNNSANNLSKLERLSTEFNLFSSIYTSLATEYELSRVKINENTPYFDLVEPAFVPLLPDDSGGIDFKVILKWFLIGVISGVAFIGVYSGLIISKIFNERLKATNFS